MHLPLEKIQDATKMIEVNGDEAYSFVRQRYGKEIAAILLVAHLRRSFGSMETSPPDPAIDEKVSNFIRTNVPLFYS